MVEMPGLVTRFCLATGLIIHGIVFIVNWRFVFQGELVNVWQVASPVLLTFRLFHNYGISVLEIDDVPTLLLLQTLHHTADK